MGTGFMDPAVSAPPRLPAYAHNDYLNPQPLSQALHLGYRGVEADYYVVNGRLLLSHDSDDKTYGRTLQEIYLDPLRERIRNQGGSVYGDGEVFLLNIESKERGIETYLALHEVLSEYQDILCVVRDGRVSPGPVQAVLVGWHPSLETLNNQPVRLAAVQSLLHELPAGHTAYPAHLLKVITLEYDRYRWDGSGSVPHALQSGLVDLRSARHAVEGRWTRVIHAPVRAKVYQAILKTGVDLIGTTDLPGSHALLRRP